MIRDIVREVYYRMYPIATINDALHLQIAVTPAQEAAVRRWNGLLDGGGRLRLPNAISAELARLATIESEITVTGDARAAYINDALDPVRTGLRNAVQRGAAAGGIVFKPYLSNGRLRVESVRAGDFWPVSFSDGEMRGAVFVSNLSRGDRLYTRLEYHRMEDERCIIEQHAYVTSAQNSGSGVLGSPCALSAVDEWAEIEPHTEIANVDRLLMGYFRMPGAGGINTASPLGVSCFSAAEELIQEAEEQWGRILWEYEGSELAVHMDSTMIRTIDGRSLIPKGKERLYRGVNADIGGRIEAWSPAIRDTSLFNGYDNILRRIEFNCALAYGTLSDPQTIDRTATEILASKQRSFATVRDVQKAIETAINDLLYAMDVWCDLAGLAPAGSYEAAYDWDDSIINDPSERKALFWSYVQAGRFPFAQYLVDFEGYSEDDAAAIVAAASGESRSEETLSFGGV